MTLSLLILKPYAKKSNAKGRHAISIELPLPIVEQLTAIGCREHRSLTGTVKALLMGALEARQAAGASDA
jgi:hypothetical protein